MALQDLSTLERLTRLQLLPAVHSTHLDTDHVLVAIVRLEVTHALRLLDPRVPDYAVHNAVSLDIKTRLSVLHDRGDVLLDRLIDTIDFAGDAELGGGLLLLFGIQDFVDVGCAAETVDRAACDVLYTIVSRIPPDMQVAACNSRRPASSYVTASETRTPPCLDS